jgi:hypothetical protein
MPHSIMHTHLRHFCLSDYFAQSLRKVNSREGKSTWSSSSPARKTMPRQAMAQRSKATRGFLGGSLNSQANKCKEITNAQGQSQTHMHTHTLEAYCLKHVHLYCTMHITYLEASRSCLKQFGINCSILAPYKHW